MAKQVIVIGVFDGVHIGHQDLVRRARQIADQRNMQLVALTFHPHPMSVVRNENVSLLATLDQRKELLLSLGADQVVFCKFTLERSRQSADEFVESFLISELNAEVIVIGEGFRFGYKAMGSADTIRMHNLEVVEVSHTSSGGTRVSSTRIRSLLAAGDVSEVKELLNRWYEIDGGVVEGFQRGRELGFPTANVDYDKDITLPADGVYAGYLTVEEMKFPAAISIGYNSTFQATERTLEVYALTQEWIEIYGRNVKVEFAARIRGMQSFSSQETLIEAIENDVMSVKKALNLG